MLFPALRLPSPTLLSASDPSECLQQIYPRYANFRIFIGLSFAMLTGIATADDSVSYSRDVRPILSQYCFKCHGPDELTRHGGLRLDHPESAYGPGDSEAIAIVPGRLTKRVGPPHRITRRRRGHAATHIENDFDGGAKRYSKKMDL